MQEEKIIRDEAKEYYLWQIEHVGHRDAVKLMREIKQRLYDFYSAEFKAIFLDELQASITEGLTEHRNTSHQGLADPTCPHENFTEKLLFYIKQEIDTLPVVAHQKNESDPAHVRNKVFVSYSHLDKDFLSDVKRHFKPFLSQVDFWDDTRIQPGQKWREEIRKAVNETKVAILLVSTDFLGSEFIASDELPPLLKAAEENGAVILIVITKPCLFEAFPELNQYQAMNPPSRPVLKMEYSEKEDLYVNLVRQTRRILSGSGSGS